MVSSAGLSGAEARRLSLNVPRSAAGCSRVRDRISYLTLTSMRRDEYGRVPESPTEAVTYTLVALNSWAPSETRAGPRGTSQSNLPRLGRSSLSPLLTPLRPLMDPCLDTLFQLALDMISPLSQRDLFRQTPVAVFQEGHTPVEYPVLSPRRGNHIVERR